MSQLSRVRPFPGIKLRVSRRNGPRRNPQNGVEGIHRVKSAVKPEYEFVEVGLQMTRLDTTMMSAIDPSLQIGENKMDHWQVLFCLLWVTTEGKRVVPVAHCSKVGISLPAVSANNGASRYIVFDKCCERFGIATRKRNICLFDAGDYTEPKTPCVSEFLDRNAAFVGILPFRTAIFGILARPHLNGAYYRRLMMNSPSFTPRARANATFVNFDVSRSGRTIPARSL
jgi:hypothetical protein